jgi:hypothetical protein
MAGKKPETDRGKIEEFRLSKPILLNGNAVTMLKIEIDHINFGINKKTKKLNKSRRSSFTISDVVRFLRELHDEDIEPDDRDGPVLRFTVRVNCPVPGKFFNKEFILIFDTHEQRKNEVHTITIVPGW